MKTVFTRADQTSKRRELRTATPPAEAILWRHLRESALGAKWRRQHSVGLFVLDFYCPTLRMAIEVDGPSHHETVEADVQRQDWIESYDVVFLRFTNQQVYLELEAVIDTIRAAMEARRRELD